MNGVYYRPHAAIGGSCKESIEGSERNDKYVLRGRLCGLLCADCLEPLSGVTVRIYSLRPNQDATRLAVADPKTTLSVLNEADVQGKRPVRWICHV